MIRIAALLMLLAVPAFGQVASRDFVYTESDYINFGDIDTNHLTAAMWVKLSDTGTAWDTLARKGSDSWYVQVDGGADDIRIVLKISTITKIKTVSGGMAALWDEWAFLGFTHDGTDLRIWINGVDQGSPTTASGNIDQGSSSVLLGLNSTAAIDGQIAYFHLYSEALSAAEMRQIMHCPGSVRENLVGYWPLTDSSTQYDYSSGSGAPPTRHNGSNVGTAASTDGPPVSLNCRTRGGS